MEKTSLCLLTTCLLFLSVHLMPRIEAVPLQQAVADIAEDQEEADLEKKSIDQTILDSYGGIEEEQKVEKERMKRGLYTDGMDLLLTKEQYELLFNEHSQSGEEHGRFKRRLRNHIKLWPNGTVFYNWHRLDQQHHGMMKTAIEEWQRYTCITFQEAKYSSQENMIFFTTDSNGCWSYLGRKGGHQSLNLDRGCHLRATYLHELGHALGLLHEHQLPQRDDYISIIWPHVGRDKESQRSLRKYSYTSVSRAHDAEYDLLSIMHYSQYAANRRRGYRTIIAHDSSMQSRMGKSTSLTFTDIKMINLFYNCSAPCSWPPSCREECFVSKACQCFCPEHMVPHGDIFH